MLILSRKVGEAIRVSNDIVVEVIAIRGARVRLGVRAPKHIAVHREEIARHFWLMANDPTNELPDNENGDQAVL